MTRHSPGATTDRSWKGRLSRALGRETSNGAALIPEIDGLRFFAIAAVVVYHINRSVTDQVKVAATAPFPERIVQLFAGQGYLGVQLFFAISGFILALPFARHYLQGAKRPGIPRYFLRRLTRLEPPYILNLLLWVGLLFALNFVGSRSLDPIRDWSFLPHFFASVFYLHNAVYGVPSTINGVAWSLEVEVQFYILAPLLTTIFLIRIPWLRRGVLLALPLAASIFAEYVLPEPYQYLQGLHLGYQLPYFLVGFLAVEAYLTLWNAADTGSSWVDLAGLAAWVAMVVVARYHSVEGVILPWLMLTAVVCAFRGRIWNSVVRMRPLVIIGGMCYTIYLYHWVVVSAGARVMEKLPVAGGYIPRLLFAIAIDSVVILAVCSVLFTLFEKPFMRRDWFNRMWLKGTLPPAGGIPPSNLTKAQPARNRPGPVPSHAAVQAAKAVGK